MLRDSLLVMGLAGALATAGAIPAAAAMTGPPAGALTGPSLAQPAQVDLSDVLGAFVFGGRQWCWYRDGWRGPGWYVCGYRERYGYGWGGGAGWNGWEEPGGYAVEEEDDGGGPVYGGGFYRRDRERHGGQRYQHDGPFNERGGSFEPPRANFEHHGGAGGFEHYGGGAGGFEHHGGGGVGGFEHHGGGGGGGGPEHHGGGGGGNRSYQFGGSFDKRGGSGNGH